MESSNKSRDEVVVKYEVENVPESPECCSSASEQCVICLASNVEVDHNHGGGGGFHFQSWKQVCCPPGTEPAPLRGNLSCIFLLRNLLRYTVEQVAEMLARSPHGAHPGEWMVLCEACSEQVRDAYGQYQRVLEAQARIDRASVGLRRKLWGTTSKYFNDDGGGAVGGGEVGLLLVGHIMRNSFEGREFGVNHRKYGHNSHDNFVPRRRTPPDPTNYFSTATAPAPPPPLTPFASQQQDFEHGEGDNDNIDDDDDDEDDGGGGGPGNDPLYSPGPIDESDDEEDGDNNIALPTRSPNYTTSTRGERQRGRRKNLYEQHKQRQQGFKLPSRLKKYASFKSQSFVCPLCCHRSGLSTTRDLHWRKSHPGASLTCTHCDDFVSESAAAFERHGNEHKMRDAMEPVESMEGGGADDDEFQCKFCGLTGNGTRLLRHMRSKHLAQLGIPSFPCTNCDMVFFSNVDLSRHTLRIHKRTIKGGPAGPREKKYKCDRCPSQFYQSCDLKGHLAQVHTENRPLLECELCGVKVAHMRLLTEHKKEEHAELFKFSCDGCEAVFQTKRKLSRHKLYSPHTGGKGGAAECRHCGKAFRTRLHLEWHLKRKLCRAKGGGGDGSNASPPEEQIPKSSGQQQRRYSCDQCDYSAGEKALLGKHVQGHYIAEYFEDLEEEEGEGETVRCKICDLTVAKAYAYRHLNAKHVSRISVHVYQCAACGKGFNAPDAFGHHVKVHRNDYPKKNKQGLHHPNAASSKGVKVVKLVDSSIFQKRKSQEFSCDKCDYTTGYKTFLGKHLQEHYISENFDDDPQGGDGALCRLCGMTVVKGYAYRHLNAKHPSLITAYVYQCAVCGKGFNAQDTVAHHAKVHKKKGQEGSSSSKSQVEVEVEVDSDIPPPPRQKSKEEQYNCEKCDFITGSKERLGKHLQKHFISECFDLLDLEGEGEDPQVAKCKECGLSVAKGYAYRHLNAKHASLITTHVYQCHICGKGFNARDNFGRHVNWHNTTTSKKNSGAAGRGGGGGGGGGDPVVCEYCAKSYSSRHKLHAHIAKCHEEEEEDAKI